jgi:ankyrin repeat protein
LVELLREHGARPTLSQAQKLGDRTAEATILNGDRAAWSDEGYSMLSVAAHRGDLALMRQLLEHGVDPNHLASDKPLVSGNYDLPLHAAADRGNFDAVKLLLEHGADPNIQQPYMERPLTAAARTGNLALVSLLLAHGADPNPGIVRGADPRQMGLYMPSALSVAAGAGNLALVKLLLAHGAKINPGGNFPPLASAAGSGRVELVRYLLEHGADPNVKLGEYDSVLAIALRRPSAAVDELLKHGANVNPAPVLHIQSDFPNASASGVQVNQPMLHVQSGFPDPPLTPLGSALWDAAQYEALLQHAGAKLGADKPIICAFAAQRGRADLLPKLLAYGADVNGMNRDGETALSVCIEHAPERVQLLLDHGANPNAVTRDRHSALEQAAMIGNAELVRLLLAHHADVNARPDRHTALEWAQRKKHADIVALLQQAGAKP